MSFDASVPNAARVYDFFLSGKDNYASDRELAQKILAILPDTADVCRDNRGFLQRQPVAVLIVAVLHFVARSSHGHPRKSPGSSTAWNWSIPGW